ncbi:MAG: YdcF family protein [Saccharofermentans sp.]|nr:YdcF family protein [Saccharofermentans sp.]
MKKAVSAIVLTGMILISSCRSNPQITEQAESVTSEPTILETQTVSQTSETVESSLQTQALSTAQIERPIIEQIITNYGNSGEASSTDNEALLSELRSINPQTADKWEQILNVWAGVNEGVMINEGVLPDGLPDTDELCIVVLGFQLNSDGSMRAELTERLNVALESAMKYPNALVLCTGGGTASQNETATEAGAMAEWLEQNGIAGDRIIVEDQSMSTAQNAIYSLGILASDYPQVRSLAIVTSDYHIPNAMLLFAAEAILVAQGDIRVEVISNAAYMAPETNYPQSIRTNAMLELINGVEEND